MDSVNSGSHHSSSDANDELYDDSRAAADSLFMPTHPSHSTYNIFTHHNSINNPNSLLPLTAQNSTTADLSMITNTQPNSLPSSAADPTNTAARNPKKRSRASRRAPTTVLTTDTSNFRAMVQEFTGIPSTPFSNSGNNTLSTSFSARTRLDLFRSSALDRPSAYLRRPLPQKFQPTLTNDTNISNIVHQQQLSASAQASDLYGVATNPLLMTSLLQTAADKFVNPTSTDIHDHHRDYNHVFRADGFHHREIDSGNFSSDQTTPLNGLPNQLVSTDHEADDLMMPMKMAKYNGDSSSNRDLASVAAVTTSDHQQADGMMESWVCSSQ